MVFGRKKKTEAMEESDYWENFNKDRGQEKSIEMEAPREEKAPRGRSMYGRWRHGKTEAGRAERQVKDRLQMDRELETLKRDATQYQAKAKLADAKARYEGHQARAVGYREQAKRHAPPSRFGGGGRGGGALSVLGGIGAGSSRLLSGQQAQTRPGPASVSPLSSFLSPPAGPSRPPIGGAPPRRRKAKRKNSRRRASRRPAPRPPAPRPIRIGL